MHRKSLQKVREKTLNTQHNDIHKRPYNSFFQVLFVLLFSCLLFGCNKEQSAEKEPSSTALTLDEDEFSVMTYNLYQYNLMDRDKDGQKDDLKPEAERQAVVDLIAKVSPDILAVQEMGDESVFEAFLFALKTAGADYPYTEYLHRGRSTMSLAVLSRFPIVSRQSHTDDIYSIGEAKMPVARGFVDLTIKINPDYSLRLMVGHLKAKVFHPMGHTEMRRNEARLLNKHVRKAIKADPEVNLLVVGDLNDNHRSAALREVLGKRKRVLFDLRPADEYGDVWTHFGADADQYSRIDYMLANAALMPEVNKEKSRVIRDPLTVLASDHRPVLTVIKARDGAGDNDE